MLRQRFGVPTYSSDKSNDPSSPDDQLVIILLYNGMVFETQDALQPFYYLDPYTARRIRGLTHRIGALPQVPPA